MTKYKLIKCLECEVTFINKHKNHKCCSFKCMKKNFRRRIDIVEEKRYQKAYREKHKDRLRIMNENYRKKTIKPRYIVCFCGTTFKSCMSNRKYCSDKCKDEGYKKVMVECLERSKSLTLIYQRERRKIPQVKLNKVISNQIRKSLALTKSRKKNRKWETLVGYDVYQLKSYIESQFDKGMTWENMGSVWHLDHRVPLSWFKYDSSDDLQFKRCWSMYNLKPMFCRDNIRKGDRYAEPLLRQFFEAFECDVNG